MKGGVLGTVSELSFLGTIFFTVMLVFITAFAVPLSTSSNPTPYAETPNIDLKEADMTIGIDGQLRFGPDSAVPATRESVQRLSREALSGRPSLKALEAEWTLMGRTPAQKARSPSQTSASSALSEITTKKAENRAQLVVGGKKYVNSSIADPLLLRKPEGCKAERCIPGLIGLGRAGFKYVGSLAKGIIGEFLGPQPPANSAWWNLPFAMNIDFRKFEFDTDEAYNLRTEGLAKLHPLVHLVRYPLSHLASLEYAFNRGGKMMSKVYVSNDYLAYKYAAEVVGIEDVEEFMKKPRRTRALILVVEWNERAEKIAHYRQRVERVNITSLADVMGVQDGKKHEPMMTRSMPCKTWTMVESYAPEGYYKRLVDMTLRYGYTLSDDYECQQVTTKEGHPIRL